MIQGGHPDSVALCQIVIHGDHMNALALQGVKINCERRHKGFTLTGFHLGNTALVQHQTTHALDIIVAHAHHSFRGLADSGERFLQNIVKACALLQPLLELEGLAFKFLFGKTLKLRLEGVDSVHDLPKLLHLALVGIKNFLYQGLQHIYFRSPSRRDLANLCAA